ncbi:MAG: hypothetical protein MI807_07175 [Verrucomicrobiales bacterium]|nr:hypothetical protein [Verrucomicrobiales bacterium]
MGKTEPHMMMAKQAFILGAGLGTRLRPLTEELPKPLVPVANRPLVTFAMDHLIGDLNTESFLINTHHCPEKYDVAFPEKSYRERNITLRHEPVLLDTAGGLDNIRDWLPTDDSFVVYNGDILTDLPLQPAWEHHLESGNLVTLILRSNGDELRVGFDPENGKIVDMRGVLQPDWPHRYQFTGIWFASPEFMRFVRPGKIESVVLCFLEAIKAGEKIGGFVEDRGAWSDLGERESYLDAAKLVQGDFARAVEGLISPAAEVDPGAKIDEISSIGPGARIGPGCEIVACSIWENATVGEGSKLERCVVRNGQTVKGEYRGRDF